VKKKILYLTDLSYQAKGRVYCEEDIYITNRLKDYFDVVLCNPINAESYEDFVDLIVFRNTGGIKGFKAVYDDFVTRVKKKGIKTFNEFAGKADMCGKQYLLELTKKHYPVIPTVASLSDLKLLPDTNRYVTKPIDGADSIGLRFITKEELQEIDTTGGGTLIEPAIDFAYEVSLYFINDKFEYALYAPNKEKRWELERYHCNDEDIEFAQKFIQWNGIKHGIQRVDACRTKDGKLLLVELEDLNPYLSILDLDENTREAFMRDFIHALNEKL